MAHSPHRRWKGCQLCKPHKFRDQGRRERDPVAVRRRLGRNRRFGRRSLPPEMTVDGR